jgi:hypothetical protein
MRLILFAWSTKRAIHFHPNERDRTRSGEPLRKPEHASKVFETDNFSRVLGYAYRSVVRLLAVLRR